MRIKAWHAARIASDPVYAKAHKLMGYAQDVADQIVGLRVRLGMTQSEVAELAGTTQAVISRLESGSGNPTAETVIKVLGPLIRAFAAMASKVPPAPAVEVRTRTAKTAIPGAAETTAMIAAESPFNWTNSDQQPKNPSFAAAA